MIARQRGFEPEAAGAPVTARREESRCREKPACRPCYHPSPLPKWIDPIFLSSEPTHSTGIKTNSSDFWIAGALAVASILCIVTATRIEHLNHLAGGAIQRKAQYEPNSKWRIGDGFHNAYTGADAQWHKEKGLSPDAELSANDREAIMARTKAMKWSPSPHDRLGMVLQSWGLVQYPLAATLLFSSLVAGANRSKRSSVPKWTFFFHASIGALALGLAFYRGYFTSLGW